MLRIDKTAAKADEHLDNEQLLRTSSTTVSAEWKAAAYKQFLAVEHSWRDKNGHLGLRPVFHHREDRILAHVQICWFALLLIRVIENTTGVTWRDIRREHDRMHFVTLATGDGRVAQRATMAAGQQKTLSALALSGPPRLCDSTTTGP